MYGYASSYHKCLSLNFSSKLNEQREKYELQYSKLIAFLDDTTGYSSVTTLEDTNSTSNPNGDSQEHKVSPI
jgi:hypothetical protein